MTTDAMNKAVDLHEKIEACKKVLSSFQWDPFPEGTPAISRKPKLIIDTDNDDNGREQIAMPGVLSDEMINVISGYARRELRKLESEFESLNSTYNEVKDELPY